jgi:biopolymer transport protein ExbB
MHDIFTGAGVFVYPLGLFSFLAAYVIIERCLALRTSRVMPKEVVDAIISGAVERVGEEGGQTSVLGRIVYFCRKTNPDPETLKAFARLEIARLERGLFILEIVIAGAPLLGLLGTITGLAQVFSAQVGGGGLPDKAAFIKGISLALSTTMVGLCIAIPAIVGNSYLHRRLDLLATRLDMGVERLINLGKRR